MYLKIKSFYERNLCVGNSNQPVHVTQEPKRCWPREYIYECQRVEVKKHEFEQHQEYCDIVNPLLEQSHPPISIIGGVPDDNRHQEMLQVAIFTKEGDELRVIAIDCDAYLTNDNGKTVDSWNCRQYPVY